MGHTNTPSLTQCSVAGTSPVILLIVSTYNCADTLARCIESFIKQTYPNKKLVIIDGGSTDGTLDVIRIYDEYIAFWLSEPDKGIYDAWNKALVCGVEADWYQFMGGDDYYCTSNVLSTVALHLRKIYPEYLLAYTKVYTLNFDGESVLVGVPWNRAVFFGTGRMRAGSSIQVGFFHHVSLFLKYGLFDNDFKIAGDLEFLLRHLIDYDPYFIQNVVSVYYTIGGISSGGGYASTHMKELVEAFARHGYVVDNTFAVCYLKIIRLIKDVLFRALGQHNTNNVLRLIRSVSGGNPANFAKLRIKKTK